MKANHSVPIEERPDDVVPEPRGIGAANGGAELFVRTRTCFFSYRVSHANFTLRGFPFTRSLYAATVALAFPGIHQNGSLLRFNKSEYLTFPSQSFVLEEQFAQENFQICESGLPISPFRFEFTVN